MLELIGPRRGHSKRTLSLLALVAALTVCFCWIAPARASAATIRQGYMSVSDGTQLKYWVETPAATGAFPVALAYGAYDEGDGNFSNTGDTPVANNLLAHGYAVLGVNLPGTGCSAGIFDVLSQQATVDGAQVVEWAASQPWSTGHVGMWGNSYIGSTQLPIALLHPKGLDAIAPWHPTADDPYRSIGYPGGIYNAVFGGGWPLLLEPSDLYTQAVPDAVQSQDPTCAHNVAEDTATGVNGLTAARLLDHPYDDGLYQSRTTAQDFSGVNIPVFTCFSWQDDALPPLDFVQHTLGAMDQKLTCVLAMNAFHTGCSSSSGISTLPLFDKFFDRYVKGENNGWEQTPHVMLWHETQKDANNNPTSRWTNTFNSWNDVQSQVKPVSLYFGSGNSLSLSQPSSAQAGDSYAYPLPGASTEGGFIAENFAGQQTNVLWKVPVVSAGSLQFATPALTRDAELFGTGSVNLWLASSANDTDLQATIVEVRPDGQETYIQRGWLRASMRKLDDAKSTVLEPYPTYAQADVQPLVAAQPTYMRLPLFAFDHVFRKGSSIRIWIDAPTGVTGLWGLNFQKTPGTNTILHDPQHPSNMTLGWLPGGNAQGTALPACDSVLNQPCRSNPNPVPSGTMTIAARSSASRSHLRGASLRGHRRVRDGRHR